MVESLKYRLAKIVESHPYPWFVAWMLMHKLTFLLPHDKSYFALKHFCQKADDNGLFLDVGANSGISALSFRQLNKRVPILSIEPNPIHANSLEKLKKKLFAFDFLLKGVGDQEMEVVFYTPVYQGIVLHTFTSTSETQVRQAVRGCFGPKVADKLVVNKSLAHIICLDTLHLKPTIIKIDAEGFDYNVLLGARKTIETHRPFLMVEACHSDVERFNSFFKERDFQMLSYNYDSNAFSIFQIESLNKLSGGRNIFAVPREKLLSLPMIND